MNLAPITGAEYVSIGSIVPCVTVTGETGGNRWSLWTYDTPATFDWSRLPDDVPVLDHRTAPEYVSHTGPSFEAYSRGDWPEVVALARAGGVKMETVADYRQRVA